MGIPDEDVRAVRDATDIVAIIGEHTGLKKVGRRFSGLCPFHSESTASFSVNAEEGLYYCFGCQASGDAITFVRATEGLSFTEAVERLGAKAGITVRNDDDADQGRSSARRRALLEVVDKAVAFYHSRLLEAPEARHARHYLRSRGYDGDIVRRFRLGYAPAGFDTLIRAQLAKTALLVEAGLAFEGRAGRGPIDAFRDRIIFPICDPGGQPIALGGRSLPEDLRTAKGDSGPKYRNSPESPVYSKRRTLYGLNWAKADITRQGQAVVCEGYTDVIGCHQSGVPNAIATCGTALTEEHIKLLSNFAKRIVLAFDADKAGQDAAARLYDWERRHGLTLAVANLPAGSDPGDLAGKDPEGLATAISQAKPYLGFQVDRALATGQGSAADWSPEVRAQVAQVALVAISAHPDPIVRDEYLMRVSDRTRLPADSLRLRLSDLITNPPAPTPGPAHHRTVPNTEDHFVPNTEAAPKRTKTPKGPRSGLDVLALAVHKPQVVAGIIDEVLFADPLQKRAFIALASANELHEAMENTDDETRALLGRLAVGEPPDDTDIQSAISTLLVHAVEVQLGVIQVESRLAQDSEAANKAMSDSAFAKQQLELLRAAMGEGIRTQSATDAEIRLLAWLSERSRRSE